MFCMLCGNNLSIHNLSFSLSGCNLLWDYRLLLGGSLGSTVEVQSLQTQWKVMADTHLQVTETLNI